MHIIAGSLQDKRHTTGSIPFIGDFCEDLTLFVVFASPFINGLLNLVLWDIGSFCIVYSECQTGIRLHSIATLSSCNGDFTR